MQGKEREKKRDERTFNTYLITNTVRIKVMDLAPKPGASARMPPLRAWNEEFMFSI